MSEVYSKTPPTEPGWYWLRFLGVDESVFELQRDLQGQSCAWRCAAYACNNSHDVMLELGYEFGPRVPSARDLTPSGNVLPPCLDADICSIKSTTTWTMVDTATNPCPLL